MIPGTYYDDYEHDVSAIVFNDARGDDDSSMLSDSLDTFSLSIESADS